MKKLFFIPFLVLGLYYANKFYNEVQLHKSLHNKTQLDSSQTENKFKIEDTTCEQDGDYINVHGYIRNIGDINYYYVDVKVLLKNENLDVLDTYNTYAVGGEGIAPNERKSFEASLHYAEGTAGCSYAITEYES
ncbi:FxLYD domain-containing protein [Lysinibacillus xylanilyticus]|uniref:FxLYD domain-containing protein n=1 Tax=Lysinibacillus xylanilyticus TaxID=582475 RepID=UPI00382D1613